MISDDKAEAIRRGLKDYSPQEFLRDDSLERMLDDDDPEREPELLHGAAAIGEFLGVTRARAQYLLETGELAPPAFKLGGRWAMRPAAFRRWCEDREGRRPGDGGGGEPG